MSCEDEHHNHNHHNGSSHQHIAPIPTTTSQSLNSKIDLYKVSALNLQNPPDQLQKLFKDQEHKFEIHPTIKSDCDEQLIINIPFLNGSVKLYSLILRTNGESYCPKTIKLYKNDKTIDFDNIDSKKPIQEITHPQIGIADDEISDVIDSESTFIEHFLQRHKFTGVQQLTIYIQNIYEDEDQCQFHSIELRGEFTELNKDPIITIYESAANPADHKNLTAIDQKGNIQFGS
ncbi:hypothetical protein KGF54_004869 [Candida jiufengensis]|uniref:uncharacterized protein n=1 Tax=Candida jiufengensis TaxID=497108 RepID=UPI00222406A1|nr:uncharacterized protein KGF54_004869 [Candida jiufengensis]KAI5951794.1 hypothetical protein KGF54_004869 [Candida jiufengensis]